MDAAELFFTGASKLRVQGDGLRLAGGADGEHPSVRTWC
jgi:hypothetical protein